MKVEWSALALDLLLENARRIAVDNRPAAVKWVRRVEPRVRALGRTPRMGRVVEELERDDIREVIVGAYRVIYRVEPKRVVVLTVFEGHRLLRADDVDT